MAQGSTPGLRILGGLAALFLLVACRPYASPKEAQLAINDRNEVSTFVNKEAAGLRTRISETQSRLWDLTQQGTVTTTSTARANQQIRLLQQAVSAWENAWREESEKSYATPNTHRVRRVEAQRIRDAMKERKPVLHHDAIAFANRLNSLEDTVAAAAAEISPTQKGTPATRAEVDQQERERQTAERHRHAQEAALERQKLAAAMEPSQPGNADDNEHDRTRQ